MSKVSAELSELKDLVGNNLELGFAISPLNDDCMRFLANFESEE